MHYLLKSLALLLLLTTACQDGGIIEPTNDGRLIFGTVGGFIPVTYQVKGNQLLRLQGFADPQSIGEIVDDPNRWEIVGNSAATGEAIQLAEDFPRFDFFRTPRSLACPGAASDGTCSLVGWVSPEGGTLNWVHYEGDNNQLREYVGRAQDLVESLWQ